MGHGAKEPDPSRGGATAIEYGLIAALIAVVIIGALQAAGTAPRELWSKLTGQTEQPSKSQ